jgi:hypothetical protein
VRYACFFCLKSVTSELPDDSIIRATLICPECLEIADQTKLNTVLEDIVNKRKKQMS